MKQNNYCGSSETIRKAPLFSFNLFYKYGHAKHVPRIDESFLEWFIGFFEGDGSFSIDSDKIPSNKKRLYLTIGQKEKSIITTIAYTFGFGSVSSFKRNSNIYWQWRISSKKGLEQIALLFFGNLILFKRQDQFLNWIKLGNKQGIFNYDFNIDLNFNSYISLNNAWLSGFIDAEGCFYANFFIKKLSNKIIKNKFYQSFSLKQTIVNENDKQIFNHILALFESKSKVYIFFPTNKTKYLSIQLNSKKSQELLINYLFNYKLKTIKYISFLRWWRIYLLKTKKKELFISQNLSEKSIKKIKRLMKAINSHSKKTYS